jgi:hypothetical protein
MMIIAFLLISTILLVTTLSSPQTGLRLYLAAVLIAPYFVLGTSAFRFEIALTPLMLVAVLLSRNRLSLAVPQFMPMWFGWWTWLLAMTAIEVIIGLHEDVLWLDIYTLLRPALLVLMFYLAGYSREKALRLARDFVLWAIPLCLFALAQVSSKEWATSATLNHYNSRAAVANLLSSYGFIVRGVATFELPANAATYFLMVLAASLVLIVNHKSISHQGRRWPLVVGGLAGLAGGLATGSATFLAGVALLLLWIVYRSISERHGKLLVGALIAALLTLALGTLFLRGDTFRTGVLRFQVARVSSGSLLDTRYGSGSGNLVPTIEAIRRQPLTGHGVSVLPGLFLGDSMYVLLLYTGGAVGLLLFGVALLLVARSAMRIGAVGNICLLWLVISLGAGVATPIFFAPRIEDWWWAMSGIVFGIARAALHHPVHDGGRNHRDRARRDNVSWAS